MGQAGCVPPGFIQPDVPWGVPACSVCGGADGVRGGCGAAAPSVLLTVSSRMLYSRTFSRWCWNSRHSLSSSSLENFPEVFAYA